MLSLALVTKWRVDIPMYHVAIKTLLISNFNHFRCLEVIEIKFGLLKKRCI